MLRLCLSLLIFFLIQSSGFGQQATGKASASGQCSPAVTGNNNTFHFQYCGSDPKEEHKIMDLLNQIVSSKDQNRKLDEILEFLKRSVNPYRGVVTYSLDGVRRTFIASSNDTQADDQPHIDFIPIQKAYADKNWIEMMRLTKENLAKYPGWFKLDYALGVAQAALCQSTYAIGTWEKVVSETEGSAEYAGMHNKAQINIASLTQPAYTQACAKKR